jgi:hypothetical protein
MTRVRIRTIGVAAGIVIVAALTTQVALSQPSPLLTPDEAAHLGLVMDPLPATEVAAPIDQLDATGRAKRDLGVVDEPVEVYHVMTRQFADSPLTSAYILVFESKDETIGGGPVGSGPHALLYQGVVVDDHTGEVLRTFSVGRV